jgi:flagellar assembly factor FliW
VKGVDVPIISSPVPASGPGTVASTSAGATVPGGVTVRRDPPELEFVRPMPGFRDLTRFVLIQVGDDPGVARPGSAVGAGAAAGGHPVGGHPPAGPEPVLYELRSVQQPQVRFLVAVPTAFFPTYTFLLEQEACAELRLQDASEALVLVVLTIGDDSVSTTANLLAPVVINARTRSAAQVILSGTDWPVRAAVV